MAEAIQSLPEYQLYCDNKLGEIYPLFHRLRQEEPVHWCEPLNGWMITRYDDVLAGLRDPRLASDRISLSMNAMPEPLRTEMAPLGVHVSNWLGFTDPPKHTRMRKLIMRVFTPRLADNMEGRIEAIVNALIDRILARGEFDLIADFAFPLPATVICEILGIPLDHQDRFRRWAEDMLLFAGAIGPAIAKVAGPAHESYVEMTSYFRELTRQRRREPRADLLSALAAVEDEEGGLTEVELIGLIVFLFIAGHETTVNLLGNGVLALLSHPAELNRLKDQPQLIEPAVEEFLRFESPIQIATRLPIEDLEIRGRQIKAGQTVILMLGAANRDPERFPEPDRFDVGRPDNKHVAFGWGSHFCLGAPLARVEARIAVRLLLERLPGLQIEGEAPLWREDNNLRSLRSLRLTLNQC
jgi:cytochrome P450